MARLSAAGRARVLLAVSLAAAVGALLLVSPAGAQSTDQTPPQKGRVLFREDFDSLVRWKELAFRKIDRHSRYRIVPGDGGGVLEVASDASASGIVLDHVFDVFAYPILEWRWRAANLLEKGDASRKSGDDYPLRVYVIFRYDAAKVGGFDRLRYEAAKSVYGEYPPLATLNYIWANKPRGPEPLVNPFTDRAVMIPMDGGKEHLGEWRTHWVNILEDYRRAFGQEPPREASLAVMGDSDNTGESTLAYVDYLEVRSAVP